MEFALKIEMNGKVNKFMKGASVECIFFSSKKRWESKLKIFMKAFYRSTNYLFVTLITQEG